MHQASSSPSSPARPTNSTIFRSGRRRPASDSGGARPGNRARSARCRLRSRRQSTHEGANAPTAPPTTAAGTAHRVPTRPTVKPAAAPAAVSPNPARSQLPTITDSLYRLMALPGQSQADATRGRSGRLGGRPERDDLCPAPRMTNSTIDRAHSADPISAGTMERLYGCLHQGGEGVREYSNCA